ncbi:MAG: HAMP domain-containing sensor histidine kinase [Eubacteriales bacterium]|nr:HAMP domain-containing sensor histidine kinase [Eubacteriales bacterium]
MEKIKKLFQRRPKASSLKTSFAVYMIIGLLAALLLSAASSALCQWKQSRIYDQYKEQIKQYKGTVISEDGKDMGNVTYYLENAKEFYSDYDAALDQALDILSVLVVPVWFAVCIAVTSILFFRRNLKKPLELLDGAAEQIARQNLDFEISYKKKDEMGRLCDSFERMRAALKENNQKMWRQIEERKRLNAAFSHDMRTPLTVLKGQSEMLVNYVPDGRMPREKIVTTAQTMQAHISRMENYVETMNRVQKLEDLEIKKDRVSAGLLGERLRDTGRILCKEKEWEYRESFPMGCLWMDSDIIMQVYENLLANAVRYAKKKVVVTASVSGGFLVITVADDGKGFTREELEKASEPFYQGSGERSGGHLGMGLYICKVLCGKHGGNLELFCGNKENPASFCENSGRLSVPRETGAIVNASFQIGEPEDNKAEIRRM